MTPCDWEGSRWSSHWPFTAFAHRRWPVNFRRIWRL